MMYCIRCGHEISDSLKFCPKCGREVVNVEKKLESVVAEEEKNEVEQNSIDNDNQLLESDADDEEEIIEWEMPDEEHEVIAADDMIVTRLTEIRNGIYICAVGIIISIITAIAIYNHYLNGWGFR